MRRREFIIGSLIGTAVALHIHIFLFCRESVICSGWTDGFAEEGLGSTDMMT
jgi:hypothetical protein